MNLCCQLFVLFLALPMAMARQGGGNGLTCTSPTNTFTVIVDLFASGLGNFAFEECAGVNPTIGMEVGETYTFLQSDRSNFHHPLGFAYFPDGAHNGGEELQPGVNPPGSRRRSNDCARDWTCPAPMYFLNGEYLGQYSNIPEVKEPANGQDDFGLEAYEPLFLRSVPEWTGYGEFSIQLRFDYEGYDKDFFYFSHAHKFMSGRIKLLRNGHPITQVEDPPLGYQYDRPGPLDEQSEGRTPYSTGYNHPNMGYYDDDNHVHDPFVILGQGYDDRNDNYHMDPNYHNPMMKETRDYPMMPVEAREYPVMKETRNWDDSDSNDSCDASSDDDSSDDSNESCDASSDDDSSDDDSSDDDSSDDDSSGDDDYYYWGDDGRYPSRYDH